MKQEIKERWIEKLESGDYPQTTGELFDGHGYCCLGVLCEVAVEDGIVEKINDGDNYKVGYRAPHVRSDGTPYTEPGRVSTYIENSVLPRAVQIWAGLDNVSPTVPFLDPEEIEPGEARETELSELNDTIGLNFSEISDLIKDNL